jgi:hypothetical protein
MLVIGKFSLHGTGLCFSLTSTEVDRSLHSVSCNQSKRRWRWPATLTGASRVVPSRQTRQLSSNIGYPVRGLQRHRNPFFWQSHLTTQTFGLQVLPFRRNDLSEEAIPDDPLLCVADPGRGARTTAGWTEFLQPLAQVVEGSYCTIHARFMPGRASKSYSRSEEAQSHRDREEQPFHQISATETSLWRFWQDSPCDMRFNSTLGHRIVGLRCLERA